LSELREILENCEMNSIERVVPSIFKRIAKCINCDHLQIRDKALCFFDSDSLMNFLKHFRLCAFPILVPVII